MKGQPGVLLLPSCLLNAECAWGFPALAAVEASHGALQQEVSKGWAGAYVERRVKRMYGMGVTGGQGRNLSGAGLRGIRLEVHQGN